LQRLVAEVGRPPLQGSDQRGLETLGPNGGVVAAPFIGEVRRIVVLLIAVDPVVNADPAGAEEASNLGDGAPGGGLQDGQGAAEEPSIRGTPQLLFELVSLCRAQEQVVHETPRYPEGTARKGACKVSTGDPLR
jgi:hypothetical protein